MAKKSLAGRSTPDLVIGILLTVLGILMLMGRLAIPYLLEAAAIGLIIIGVLMLLGRLAGSQLVAVAALVVGVLLLLPLGASFGPLLHLVAAVLVLVAGILKLLGTW
ncbi:MAG: hypothetical protein ACPGQL_11240 [Thermoplasmatota archaeon]